MSSKQRREREKQELKRSILTAARAIAQQDGWQAVTIRKVAERIEYSPPTIYEYFASKDEILLELLREGFHILAQELKAVKASTQNCEECLHKMADAYWNFAMSNPELYQVMHGLGGAPFECQEKPHAVREAFVTTQEALTAWMQDQHTTIPDIEGAVEIMRSLIHGLISLTMVDRIRGGEQAAKHHLHRAIHDLLIAWSSTKQE